MSPQDIISRWIEGAQEDMEAAEAMYGSSHYHWSLFLWHLTIEKLLKALLTKQEKEVPYTHNLVLLAEFAGLTLVSEEKDELKEMTTFNLEARYDDYKLSFYKKATKDYTDMWIKICKKWKEAIEKHL